MSFASQARQIMGPVQHEWLRRALDVTLEDDPAHPMEPGRIDALNAYLHAAARRLLDIPVVDEASLNDQLDTLSADIADVPVLRNEALLG